VPDLIVEMIQNSGRKEKEIPIPPRKKTDLISNLPQIKTHYTPGYAM